MLGFRNDDFYTFVKSMHLNPYRTIHGKVFSLFIIHFIHYRPKELFSSLTIRPEIFFIEATALNIGIRQKELNGRVVYSLNSHPLHSLTIISAYYTRVRSEERRVGQ